MVNEKIIRRVKSFKKRGVPFIIYKYGITAFGLSNNVYEVLSIQGRRVKVTDLTRDEAVKLISELELPIQFQLDSRTIIWGDDKFKKTYKKLKGNGNSDIY